MIAYDLGDRSRQLSYDAAGRITAYADSDLNFDQSFAYDELGRLIDYSQGNGQSLYDYDANGNRIQQQDAALIKTFSRDASSNRLQAVTDGNGQTLKSHRYDAAGHLTNDGYNQFDYDARGRLVQVSNLALGTLQYRINGLGQRTAKIGGKASKSSGDDDGEDEHRSDRKHSKNGKPGASAGIYFVYDEASRLLGEYDQKGKAIQETVWLGDMPVAVLKKRKAYYVYADHLNTPRAISDQHGQVVWRWDSDPFGVGMASAGLKSEEDKDHADEDPDQDGQSFAYNLRFPGQYYDQETGLHYNAFRDYDPATGRYIQSDPIGLKGGLILMPMLVITR